jgi:hypothetical protein
MAELCPSAVSPSTNRIRVLPTLQVSTDPNTERHTLERLAALSLHATPPASPSATNHPLPATITPIDAVSSPSNPSSADPEAHPDLSHIFAIGDCADTGAIQAGHTAYWMGEVAARNILRLIARDESNGNGPKEDLEVYKYGKPAIKVTLGLVDAVISNAEGTTPNSDGKADMSSRVIWDSHDAGHLPDDA